MKTFAIGSALALLLATPALAVTGINVTQDQSVYRTVETSTIMNDDGSVSQQTITTIYSIFGIE